MNEIHLLLKYPSILPLNLQQTEYRGYLPVNGTDYRIYIKHADGKLELELTNQLEPYKDDILNLLKQPTNPLELLNRLRSLLDRKTIKIAYKNHSHAYRRILNEYIELKEFYINLESCTISKDLSKINVTYLDECRRRHNITISNDLDDCIFKVSYHTFPEVQGSSLFKPNASPRSIIQKFLKVIEILQPFFETMDRLDNNCWILDPEKPTKKDCYRRIRFDVNTSMIIKFNPWNKGDVPEIKFLGPERQVQVFRNKISNNLTGWDSNNDIIDEILKLLELPILPNDINDAAKEEEIVLYGTRDCCICFSLRLNDKLPEIICENASCNQLFHKSCLYEWFASVGSKQSFDEISGKCPNCYKHIVCPL